MVAQTEPINPRLDALLHEQLDDANTQAVYADWLEEQGAPRAELIRFSLQAARVSRRELVRDGSQGRIEFVHNPLKSQLNACIARNWSHWFGSISARELEVHWALGFPLQVRLLSRPVLMTTLKGVCSLPSLRFVRTLIVPPGVGTVTTEGIDQLCSLRALIWSATGGGTLAPLAAMTLPRLEALLLETSVLTVEDLAGLSGARLPALATFSFSGNPLVELDLLATVLHASWFAGLKSLTLQISSPETVRAVVAAAQRLEPLGAGLVLQGPAGLLASHRQWLRSALPQATLRPLASTSAPHQIAGNSFASAVPVRAPANFRDLPPRTLQPGAKDGTVYVGSGVPTAAPGKEPSLCASCASADTWEIFSSWSQTDGSDPTTFTAGEYECRECGRFTHWENSRDSG